MAEIDAEQRHELELMIRELETENAHLQEEYKHLQASNGKPHQAHTSSPGIIFLIIRLRDFLLDIFRKTVEKANIFGDLSLLSWICKMKNIGIF